MRVASIGLVALAVLAVAVPARAGDPLAEATTELAKLSCVDGDSVGFDGVEGRFFRLSKVFLAKGGKAEFERLLRHARPVVRAMGLVCLTHTEGKQAVPVLKKHLADPGRFLYGPGG